MRLIDADELLENLKQTDRYFMLKFDIENAPTVEPVERPHGEWKEMWHSGKDIYSCSECFEAYKMPIQYNFCPNCGSDNRPLKHGCCFASEECKKNPCKDCGLKKRGTK